MRTIVIGDIHGRSIWKYIVDTEKWDKLIFVGDYFDSYEEGSYEQQQRNFQEIVQLKEANLSKVVLLIGNHDYHYFPFIGNTGISGYNEKAAPSNGHLLSTYKDLLQMAYAEGDYLFTHAGVGKPWLTRNYPGDIKELTTAKTIASAINLIWKAYPYSFIFNGYWDGSGDDVTQTPIWIRPKSLKIAAKDFKKSIIQVVGHTTQNSIDIKGKSTGGRYYFIDALDTSGEYLIIEDGKPSVGLIYDTTKKL